MRGAAKALSKLSESSGKKCSEALVGWCDFQQSRGSETIDKGYAGAWLLVCAGAIGNVVGKLGVKKKGEDSDRKVNYGDECIVRMIVDDWKRLKTEKVVSAALSGDALGWFRIILRSTSGLIKRAERHLFRVLQRRHGSCLPVTRIVRELYKNLQILPSLRGSRVTEKHGHVPEGHNGFLSLVLHKLYVAQGC